MKYFLIAGERSGDLHGSNLIKEMNKLSAAARFIGFGGELMEEEGMELLAHYSQYSLMGFVEVLFRYRAIRKYLRLARKLLDEHKPDVLILIDFGGFNMRMARYAKEQGIRVVYYIPPKVWAWNTGRAEILKKNVDLLLSILPFEKDFYRNIDWEIEYVGNPLNDSIRQYLDENRQTVEGLPDKKIIALLPGSRPQELKKIVPLLIKLAQDQSDKHFLVAALSNLNQDLYRPLQKLSNVEIIFDRTYDILLASHAAVVTSGTATLETGLLNIPQVVVYKANQLSFFVGKRLVKVNHISLVNLILDKPLIKELLQGEANHKSIAEEINALSSDVKRRREVLDGYQELKSRVGDEPASYNAARSILDRWS